MLGRKKGSKKGKETHTQTRLWDEEPIHPVGKTSVEEGEGPSSFVFYK